MKAPRLSGEVRSSRRLVDANWVVANNVLPINSALAVKAVKLRHTGTTKHQTHLDHKYFALFRIQLLEVRVSILS